MFQKEVAERICSKKGKNRGLTVLWFRLSLTAKYVLMWEKKISTPKVTSTVIKLLRNNRKN